MVDLGDNNLVPLDYEWYLLVVIDLVDDVVVHVDYKNHRLHSHDRPRRWLRSPRGLRKPSSIVTLFREDNDLVNVDYE